MHRSKKHRYSITSSAIVSCVGGTGKSVRLGSLEIDEQFDFRRLLHWQIGRLLAVENPAGVDTGLTVHVGKQHHRYLATCY